MVGEEKRKISVVVVDDDVDLLATIEIQLHLRGFAVHTEQDAEEGIRTAEALRPDIILLDIGLPGMSGVEAVRVLRSRFTTACSGIIMVTAVSDPEAMRSSVHAGADDYIVKPYNITELCCRIEMVKERINRNLERNPLTGLPGNNLIHHELLRRIDNQVPFAIGYVDIDNFKAYNDRYGPEKGDQMIAILSKALVETAASIDRDSDFVGHIGGDDFVLITEPGSLNELCDTLFRRFDRDIQPLYSEEDRAAGGIVAEGRDGVRRFFPKAGLSVGAVSTLHSVVEKPQRAFELATQAKHWAKSSVGSRLEIWGNKPFDRDQAAAAAERLHVMDSWHPSKNPSGTFGLESLLDSDSPLDPVSPFPSLPPDNDTDFF